MENQIDFDLDDFDDQDIDAIINHLHISNQSTNIIGEFCEGDDELIRQNIFTISKELKIALAIITSYRDKTNRLTGKIIKYQEHIKKLEDDNSELQHKINLKNKLLNELLAADEMEDRFNMRNSFLQQNYTHSQTLVHDYNSILSTGDDRNGPIGSKIDSSSSDFENGSKDQNNNKLKNYQSMSSASSNRSHTNLSSLNDHKEGINFYVEKMQELCLSSMNLTRVERNVIEQFVAHFADHVTQNQCINEFLSSNIEDAIQQKDELNDLIMTIQRLEHDKNELKLENEDNNKKFEKLIDDLETTTHKLNYITKKCDLFEDYCRKNYITLPLVVDNIKHMCKNGDILDENQPNLAIELEKYTFGDVTLKNNLKNMVMASSSNISFCQSSSVPEGGESSFCEDSDYQQRQSIKTKVPLTPKFKLVKSMEGSNMLKKWKKLATTSRGLQITKELFGDDTDTESNNNTANKEVLNTQTAHQSLNNTNKKGPKIIPVVTRMGHMNRLNKTPNDEKLEYIKTSNLRTPTRSAGIMSRFGAVEDPFDISKSISTPTNNNNSCESEYVINNVNNTKIPTCDTSNNKLLVENLLKNLDNTLIDMNNHNETKNTDTIVSDHTTSLDRKPQQNRYGGLSSIFSRIRSPFK